MQEKTVEYYCCDNGAYRVFEDEYGDLTADLYQSGYGHISVEPIDVLFYGLQISESEYKELVLKKIIGQQNNKKQSD